MSENQYKKGIRGYQPEERPADSMTARMYQSQKASWHRVKDHLDWFSAKIQKQFLDMKKFIDGYEDGTIKYWYEFYKTAEEIRNEWNDCNNEEYIRKYNYYYRDTGILIKEKVF